MEGAGQHSYCVVVDSWFMPSLINEKKIPLRLRGGKKHFVKSVVLQNILSSLKELLVLLRAESYTT